MCVCLKFCPHIHMDKEARIKKQNSLFLYGIRTHKRQHGQEILLAYESVPQQCIKGLKEQKRRNMVAKSVPFGSI